MFPNNEAPLDRHHHAYCKDLMFDYKYSQVPTIIISASHSTGYGKLVPDYNSIAVWLEVMTYYQPTLYLATRCTKTFNFQVGKGITKLGKQSTLAWFNKMLQCFNFSHFILRFAA